AGRHSKPMGGFALAVNRRQAGSYSGFVYVHSRSLADISVVSLTPPAAPVGYHMRIVTTHGPRHDLFTRRRDGSHRGHYTLQGHHAGAVAGSQPARLPAVLLRN